MRKLITICLLLITGLTQAQNFDFECSSFGDLGNFMPSNWDKDGTPPVRTGTFNAVGNYAAGGYNIGWTHKIKEPSDWTVDFGDSVIHHKTDTNVLANKSSDHVDFNGFRVTGGDYHGYVMVNNTNTREIFAKWSGNGDIKLIFIFHKQFQHSFGAGNSLKLEYQNVSSDFSTNLGTY